MTMTKANLGQQLALLTGITRSKAAEVVDLLLNSVIEALRSDDKVEIRGFGSFRTRVRKSRRGRNPKTGEPVNVPAQRIAYFKPGKHLRAGLNSDGD